MPCKACGAANPGEARFCMACGSPLTEAEPIPFASAFEIPKSFGDRKPMTIVFADIVGSTTIAEAMDPEDWRGVVSLLFGRVAAVVDRYEGTIGQFLGDGLLVYFGAPVAHEDDPARAIHAALDALEVVDEVEAETMSRYDVRLQIRVGIHTGLVVVGDLKVAMADALASEYVAHGDAMNLAARIESVAEPMTVFVSDETHRLSAPQFDWVDRGTFELKGKLAPVHLWQALGRREGRPSLRGLAGVEAPMVGRDAELERMLKATEAFARDGTGTIVTIIGEPGIGKTRLTSEWAARAPGTIDWVRTSCLSYGRRLAYHLIVDLLHSALGAGAAANDDEVRSRLDGAVARWLGGSPASAALLANLLSLPLRPEEEPIVEALDARARQARYIRTVGDLLRARATERPTVVLIEDVHWADPTSVLVLRSLLPLAAETPILFCVTSRHDIDAPAWALVSDAASTTGAPRVAIELEPLAVADTKTLVHALLATAGAPTVDVTDVLAHAEGNPFFAEEIVRMLLERTDENDGSTPQAAVAEIPPTIHGLLLARLDTLPPPLRRTTRLAAVAGRRFSVRLLEEVRAG